MIRWEFARAKDVDLELWDAKKIEQETSEILHDDELALTIGYDEVFVLVGTRRELGILAAQIGLAVQSEPETIEREEDEDAQT